MSQLKLLPSLFDLKDNEKIVLGTIIEKLQDMSRNRSFLIIEVGKITRLLLLSQATKSERDSIFSVSKRVKTYPRSTIGHNRRHALILVHLHKIILGNINLADVVNFARQ